MQKYAFPKKYRLTKRFQFWNVYKKGWIVKKEGILVYLSKNELSYTRMGITVCKKYGKANKRNRIKRLLREAFRLTVPNLPTGLDFIIHPQKVEKKVTLQELKQVLEEILKQAVDKKNS